MKKFVFKFEKLLKIREYEEMKAKQNYAVVLQKKLNIERDNRELEKSILNSNKELFIEQKPGEVFNAADLILYENYAKGARLKIIENNKTIQELNKELIPLKEVLLEATRQKKTMEKLKEHENDKYTQENKKIIAKTNSNIANLIYVKKGEDKNDAR